MTSVEICFSLAGIDRVGQEESEFGDGSDPRSTLPAFTRLENPLHPLPTTIEVLPSCITSDRPAKYEPVKAGEYVEGRLAETNVKAPPAPTADA